MADTKHGEIDKSHGALSRAGISQETEPSPMSCVTAQCSIKESQRAGGGLCGCECLEWDRGGAAMSPLCAVTPARLRRLRVRGVGMRDGKSSTCLS